MIKRSLAGLMLLAAFAAPALAAAGTGPVLALRAGGFFPSDDVFREVYGTSLSFAADLSVPLTGPLQLWAGAEFLNKTGLLPISEEASKVRIVPLFAGLRLQFGQKSARPYFGVAAAYFMFQEENPIGAAEDNALGLIAQAGLQARLGGPVWLDLFTGYRSATVRTEGEDPLEAKLDGFSAGLGLAYRF